jgi:hypothetical protein
VHGDSLRASALIARIVITVSGRSVGAPEKQVIENYGVISARNLDARSLREM